MGIVHHPNVVTDGLIALWDAGNRRSYPGTGTVWTDTVGGHNGVLTNGPTFSEDNFGSIIFDGSDDRIVIPDSDVFDFGTTGPFSISMWFKVYGAAITTYQTLWSHYGWPTGTSVFITTAQPIVGWEEFRQLMMYVGSTYKLGTTGLNDNAWHNVTVTRASDGAYAMYVDAVVQNSGTGLTGSGTHTNDVAFGTTSTGDYPLMGSINYEMVYNRALTADQVLQNYNAMKPRFIPRVTLEGLMANWDAGNPHSYAGAGTTWRSLVNDHEGTLTNGPTFSTVGGGSILFDGTDDYVDCGDATDIVSAVPLTVTVWFKWVTEKAGFIVSGTAPEMEIWHYDGNIYIDGSGILKYFSWVFDKEWHHIVFADEGSGTYRAYLDGVLQSLSDSDYVNSQGNFYIGGRTGDHKFEGNIATVRVYNRAFSADEVLQNYQAVEPRFASNIIQEGLTANWDANDRLSYPGTGTTWTSLVKEFKGTLTNGPAFSSDNGGIIDFDGTNDYVSVPDSSLLRFGEGQFTISMWVFDENDDLSYYAWMTKGQTGADEWSLYHSGSNRLRFYADSGGIDMSYTGVMASAWHHIVATRDSTQANLYRDGISVATDTSEDYDLNTTKDISIGASEEGSARFTTGKIANVQLYDRALTADEVLQNYNVHKGRFV